jgi:3-methyladenine DNA glycosylase Mpg
MDTVSGHRVELHLRTKRAGPVHVGPRVGIRKAADRPLRFTLAKEKAVSLPRPLGGRASRQWRARVNP